MYVSPAGRPQRKALPSLSAFGPLLNVKSPQFGAAGDNYADDTAAINAAIASAAVNFSGGGAVYLPPGIYRVSSLSKLPPNVSLIGESRGSVFVRTTSASADVIQLDGAQCQVRSLTIDSAVSRTSGYFINPTTNCSRITLQDLNLNAPFSGIHIPDIAIVALRDIVITNTVASTGNSIIVDGGYVILLDDVVCQTSRCFSHLQINHCNDITTTNCQFLQSACPVYIAPGSGKFLGEWLSVNSQFDAPQTNQAIRITPGAGGVVNKVFIANAWISKVSGQSNVLVTNAGGGTVNGISIVDSILTGAGGTDTALDFTGVSNVVLRGNKTGSHATGLSLASCTDVLVQGNILGGSDGYANNTTGIAISGSSDYVVIEGNDLRNNTTPLSNSASGTHNKIANNLGYPTVGNVSSITVTASPFTYTAGPQPETVFVNGGTVSALAVNGTTVLGATNHAMALGPNETLTVTYTVAPTMTKVLH